MWDYPSGLVVKNPPARAGDIDSIPDPGTRIPHVAEQLSLLTTRQLSHHTERSHMTQQRSRMLQLRPDMAK